MLSLTIGALAFSATTPLRRAAPRASVQMNLVDSVKDSIVPANTEQTFRNVWRLTTIDTITFRA